MASVRGGRRAPLVPLPCPSPGDGKADAERERGVQKPRDAVPRLSRRREGAHGTPRDAVPRGRDRGDGGFGTPPFGGRGLEARRERAERAGGGDGGPRAKAPGAAPVAEEAGVQKPGVRVVRGRGGDFRTAEGHLCRRGAVFARRHRAGDGPRAPRDGGGGRGRAESPRPLSRTRRRPFRPCPPPSVSWPARTPGSASGG